MPPEFKLSSRYSEPCAEAFVDDQKALWFVDLFRTSLLYTKAEDVASTTVTKCDAGDTFIGLLPCGSQAIWLISSHGRIIVVSCDSLKVVTDNALDFSVNAATSFSANSIVIALETAVIEVTAVWEGSTCTLSASEVVDLKCSIGRLAAGNGMIVGATTDGCLALQDTAETSEPVTAAISSQIKTIEVVGRSCWVTDEHGQIFTWGPRSPLEPLPSPHTHSVVAILPMGDKVWTIDTSSQAVLWNTGSRRPVGAVLLSDSDLRSLRAGSTFLCTSLCGVDDTSGCPCLWSLNEPYLADQSPKRDRQSQVSPAVDNDELTSFLRHLCDILTGEESSYSTPPPTASVDSRCAYLPEALRSLASCRNAIYTIFTQLGWESSNLLDDVEKLNNHALTYKNVEQRAVSLAAQLSELTGLPLPCSPSEPVEMLLTAAECGKECLNERNASEAASSELVKKIEFLENHIASSQSVSTTREHEYEERIKEAENEVRYLKGTSRDRAERYEAEIEALKQELTTARASSALLERNDRETTRLTAELAEVRSELNSKNNLTQELIEFAREQRESWEYERRRRTERERSMEDEIRDQLDSEKLLQNKIADLQLQLREGRQLLRELKDWLIAGIGRISSSSAVDATVGRLSHLLKYTLKTSDGIETQAN